MAAKRVKPVRNVLPDSLDWRDRAYAPPISLSLPASVVAPRDLPILDQGDSSACTGFALATVIHHLLDRARRSGEAAVSPWMLYSMARRYDEFPGAADRGSSLRGALRGWHRHGVCASKLWTSEPMPRASLAPGKDWWGDAVRRPLGAYYRVAPRSLADLHAAIAETGIVYASAACHAGWLEGHGRRARAKGSAWTIPLRSQRAGDGGHAFAIVGYDADGLLIQNSWGKAWGDGGFARLVYDDWLANAMDCWVVQLGVVTSERRRVAAAPTPVRGTRGGGVSPDLALARHQVAPYVIGMQGDGTLASFGAFRTQDDDVRALAEDYLDAARKHWRVRPGRPLDIVIYAHGGLVSERDASATFARWWPALYAARCLPVFLSWESDLLSTLASRLAGSVARAQRPTATAAKRLGDWWDARLESLLAPAGTALWEEIKSKAQATSQGPSSGVQSFFRHLAASPVAKDHPLRLHLVGHSAGSIVLAALIDRLAAREWSFESVTFLAPALPVAGFDRHVLPWLESGAIRRYRQFHLADAAEQRDESVRALLGYGRSLLYLVSESFEGGRSVPILGLERDVPARLARRKGVRIHVAPGPNTGAAVHGDFDDDALTLASVIAGMGK